MIVIDLDGTLLNSYSEITDENLDAIRFAKRKGVEVVIATGRGQFDVLTLLKGSGLSPWIIGANGATIHRPDGRLFKSFPLDLKQAIPVLQWLETNEYYYEVFSEKAIFTPENGRRLIEIELDRLERANPETPMDELRHSARQQFKQSGFEFIPSYRVLPEKSCPIYNILAFSFDEEKLKNGREKFASRKDLHVSHSGYHNFEIESKHASKGKALKKLANELGIRLENVLAIGDSINDLSMLKTAGISVAMGNADKKVIDMCHYQTDTNDRNGVGKLIYRFLCEHRPVDL